MLNSISFYFIVLDCFLSSSFFLDLDSENNKVLSLIIFELTRRVLSFERARKNNNIKFKHSAQSDKVINVSLYTKGSSSSENIYEIFTAFCPRSNKDVVNVKISTQFKTYKYLQLFLNFSSDVYKLLLQCGDKEVFIRLLK